jgi:hypothetical protein
MIQENVRIVREKIAQAAKECGRNPEEITLIAATKGRSIDEINMAIRAGIADIGENRVQELLEKYDKGVEPVTWHFIGRLQTNKVKYIIDKVDLIHSVDSMKLAEEIDKRAGRIGKIQNVLVQVNFFDEASKAGIAPSDVIKFMEKLQVLQNVKVRGLTFMTPQGIVINLLHKCNGFVIDIKAHFCDNVCVDTISFGMSGDYECAVRNGSTAVRIGSCIFGG